MVIWLCNFILYPVFFDYDDISSNFASGLLKWGFATSKHTLGPFLDLLLIQMFFFNQPIDFPKFTFSDF